MALNLPEKIQAGDSLQFTDSLSNYPATTWTLTYTLINENLRVSFSATASGTDHYTNVSPATSAKWIKGTYKYLATVSDGSDRFTVGSGTVKILADVSEPSDQREHCEKVLDAIEAVIEGKATRDQSSYSIAGRSLSTYSPPELLAWRDKYKQEVKSLRQAEKVAAGLGSGRLVKVRF